MPDTSYEADANDAMSDAPRYSTSPWIELPCHKELDEAVSAWLSHTSGNETFRVSGAAGTGKSQWFRHFAEKFQKSHPQRVRRTRWIVARFGLEEPVTSESLIRQWSTLLLRWVERPARYAQGSEARKWLDLAIQTQQAEGFTVLRAIESDRTRLRDDPAAASLTKGILWLAREPFRGSRKNDHSMVLPVWSHDELALVLSRLHPSIDWPDSIVSEIWSKSSGKARHALKLAAKISGRKTNSRIPT
ncbi:hypothetical protein GC170_18585 [bacterium]|nr:hypothetical protein [bacterium]